MDTNTRQYIVSLGVKFTQKLLSENVRSIEDAFLFLIENFQKIENSPIRLFSINENNEYEEIFYVHGEEIRRGDDRLSLYQLSSDIVSKPTANKREHANEFDITIPFRHNDKLVGFLQYTKNSCLNKDMVETLDVYGRSVALGLFVVLEKEQSVRQQALFNRIMKIIVELRSKHDINDLVSTFVNEVSSFFRYDRTTAFIYDKVGKVKYFHSVNAKGRPLEIINVPEIPNLDQGMKSFEDICGWWLPIKSKDQILGCILVDNIYTLSSIDEKHLFALEELSNLVGLMIDNIRLFDDIEKIARVDYLTGIYNRRVGIDYINRFIDNANKSQRPFVLCYVDLNGLKVVNDTKGHNVGDEMIRQFVHIMNKIVRTNDILSRIGGDEFVILFPDCDMDGAEIVWQRILNELESFNKCGDKPYKLHASHGMIVYNPDSNVTPNRLLAIADKRMYKEKKQMDTAYNSRL